MSVRTLSRAHRAELRTLTTLAERDLALIWSRLSTTDAIATRDALAKILPPLVAMYGAAAATLAADWYDDLRAEAGVGGRFTAITATLPDAGRTEALAGWAVSPLFAAKPDTVSALTLAAGGLQRIIANADRETVTASSIADPKAQGWVRVGNGECDWCSSLLDGEIHYVEGYGFDAHDHCHCTAEPVWD